MCPDVTFTYENWCLQVAEPLIVPSRSCFILTFAFWKLHCRPSVVVGEQFHINVADEVEVTEELVVWGTRVPWKYIIKEKQ